MPRNEALVPHNCAYATAERGPHSANSSFVAFENTAKLKPVSKMNFLPMKGEKPITSYCILTKLVRRRVRVMATLQC